MPPAPHLRTRPRSVRALVARVFANASVLAFASLFVISAASGRAGAALLWVGALLVFLAPAVERPAGFRSAALVGGADTLRWCGLALALAGAALLF